jgi:NAD-dependent DNA ligase
LIFSTGSLNQLPVAFEALFADERIALVGVNVNGDGARLARDFKCTVNGLLNVALRKAKTSMEDLAAAVCPREFRVKKDSIESKVRLSNWAQWPLTELQLKYASLDAVLSFAIFFFQQFDRNKTGWDDAGAMTTDSIAMEDLLLQTQHPEESNGKVAAPRETNNGAHGHFFIMHRNRSIVPPNLEKKVHPTGTANALDGVVAIISGVLDSMSRDEMTKYIQRHGGKVVKSVTNSTTMLINDHGTVGPSKRKKIEAKNIPIVSEDVIFDMVRKSSIP